VLIEQWPKLFMHGIVYGGYLYGMVYMASVIIDITVNFKEYKTDCIEWWSKMKRKAKPAGGGDQESVS